MSTEYHPDIDPVETQEWRIALEEVMAVDGPARAQFLLNTLQSSVYLNTIPVDQEPQYPGDLALETQLSTYIRWNAMAMVAKAAKTDPDLGGHIGTYASACTLYEVGFNHFWRANTPEQEGDLVFIQGHSAPGIYARSFLEGVFSEEQILHFRQEVSGQGLSSYPHPWLLPDYWQFPTVSMGLGPMQAVYQARFLRYLEARGLAKTQGRRVWCFCGDGEMDEPESVAALSFAVREKLDNLTFVINCNLQRLDGPVRGNGSVVQELEGIFSGAGWNVIKVLWNSAWDALFEKDTQGILVKSLGEVLDGEYQNYAAKGPAYLRKHFFEKSPELQALIAGMTDDDLAQLGRGGHDPQKIYAAYHAAVHHKTSPTVILAKTVKGYGLGAFGEAQNIAHNVKKMDKDAISAFKDRFAIPLTEEQALSLKLYHPGGESPAIQYLMQCRRRLGGTLPARRRQSTQDLVIPDLSVLDAQLKALDRPISTTMAFVRILTSLCKDKNIGARIVPIVADEARTFGMEGLFRQLGIYSPMGQLYQPVDSEQVMFYKESPHGQLLQEGLNEAGSICSWLAAATSYSHHNAPMIPFYIYYSMFGFQRIGDFAWAAGDSRARGFLIGGTSGRTTLNGEGLQHGDGHSHILASTIPNCITYDPTYAYELAVIIQSGLHRMWVEKQDVFYYITTMNENYEHPAMPKGAETGIIKGMYCLSQTEKTGKHPIQLLGCGSILREVLAAAVLLAEAHDVHATVWSVTSFNELARDGQAQTRWNLLHADQPAKTAYITECLQATAGPVIAATDYIKLFAEQVRGFIPRRYVVLGTDGFGRSDTRAALRGFFEVNRYWIVLASLKALADEGAIDPMIVMAAMQKYGLDPHKPNPLTV
jgi:pyruvate dehydrogenase E1 component